MTKNRILDEWLSKAGDDLELARRAIRTRKKIVWAACFHAHQSAEKFLKGFLFSHGVDPKRTHDLIDLLERSRAHSEELGFLEPLCQYLNTYAVQIRYPDEMNLTLSHAKKAIRAAEQIQKAVLTKLERE